MKVGDIIIPIRNDMDLYKCRVHKKSNDVTILYDYFRKSYIKFSHYNMGRSIYLDMYYKNITEIRENKLKRILR